MLVFAVVSAVASEEAVDVFIRREDAETFVREVRDDDAELAAALQIQVIEFDSERNGSHR